MPLPRSPYHRVQLTGLCLAMLVHRSSWPRIKAQPPDWIQEMIEGWIVIIIRINLIDFSLG